jgi:signal transduction histidine kinase
LAAAAAAGLSVLNLWWALPAAVAAFSAGLKPGRTRSAMLVLVAVLAAGVVTVSLAPAWLEAGSWFVAVVTGAVMLPWFAGRFLRQYRQLIRAGWDRAEHLEREQLLVAEQARLRERARIAQDMHDVLGHDLSLIALSAGALKLAPGLPSTHREAAQDIRARAASAVERLGEVIGVLREDTDGTPAQPTGIAGLVEAASASGLAVTLHVEGEAAGLPPAVERAARRVVQEALTNVAKHAPGAATTVQVWYTAAETHVRVENGPVPVDVPTAPSLPGGGRGLIGLDERVRLAGGLLGYGPGGGGFTVEARLPHALPTRTPPPSGPERRAGGWSVPQEHRRAHRRLGRTLVAALMVPLVTGALLSAVLQGRLWLAARQSVLDPHDYAQLPIGHDLADVRRYLPDRQTADRPEEPQERGVTCEYYAMTSNPFDDRYSDAFRLCFRDGMLVSKEELTAR